MKRRARVLRQVQPHGCSRARSPSAHRVRGRGRARGEGVHATTVSVRGPSETNGQERARSDHCSALRAGRSVRGHGHHLLHPVVTGANRGLGRALVDALLERGVAKLYALARDPRRSRQDPRWSPSAFDLLDRRASPPRPPADDATLLINNASTAAFSGPLEADPAAVRTSWRQLRGPVRDRPRVPPGARAADDAHVVNVLSLLSLASTPPMTGYSASKAAAHSLTQALRPIAGRRRHRRARRLPAGIDTDMSPASTSPKTPRRRSPPACSTGSPPMQEDIFPDPNARAMADVWWSDPRPSSAPSPASPPNGRHGCGPCACSSCGYPWRP